MWIRIFISFCALPSAPAAALLTLLGLIVPLFLLWMGSLSLTGLRHCHWWTRLPFLPRRFLLPLSLELEPPHLFRDSFFQFFFLFCCLFFFFWFLFCLFFLFCCLFFLFCFDFFSPFHDLLTSFWVFLWRVFISVYRWQQVNIEFGRTTILGERWSMLNLVILVFFKEVFIEPRYLSRFLSSWGSQVLALPTVRWER